jgi:hypothetical protein
MLRYCKKHYAKFCLLDEDATSLKGSWQANEDTLNEKTSIKGKNNWLRFSHTILISMVCGVEVFPNFGLLGVNFSNFFKDLQASNN